MALRRDSGDAGGDSKADVTEVTQLPNECVYLMRVGSLRIEDRLGVVEEENHVIC